jgi:hypothetical protein
MDATLYFLTRTFFSLTFFGLITFGLGLWLGYLKWFHWQKHTLAYQSENKSLKSSVQKLGAEVTDRAELQRLVAEFKDANDHLDRDVSRLTTSLNAAKRNQEDIENLWRRKCAALEEKIATAPVEMVAMPVTSKVPEVALSERPAPTLAPAIPRPNTAPITLAAMEEATAAIARLEKALQSSESALEAADDVAAESKLINFPQAESGPADPAAANAFSDAKRTPAKKRKSQRAVAT